MQSIRKLYKIGPGPSSSHTIAPYRAMQRFINAYPDNDRIVVTLFGSLALTGKGHLTDKILQETAAPCPCEIVFSLDNYDDYPLTFIIEGQKAEQQNGRWVIHSVGGGEIEIIGLEEEKEVDPYPHHNFESVKAFCLQEKIALHEYVYRFDDGIFDYLKTILSAMLNGVDRGLKAQGVLPGKLQLSRSAKSLYWQAEQIESGAERQKLQIMAYAYASSEENADGKMVVTAPTLGSCGIIPAVMSYYYQHQGISKTRLINALATAGVFGNIVKENATISGAVGGCQAEVGTACAMAAAAIAYLEGLNIQQIEYAAEIGIEHHLGLTCDPIGGYVMIPCIERNAVAAIRAFDAVSLAKYLYPIKPNKITFDMVVNTMNYTGSKLAVELKETSLGGLAMQIIV